MDTSTGDAEPTGPPVNRTQDGGEELDDSALALLDAFASISSDLDTRSVLIRIVTAAADLTAARYGALGVIGSDGRLGDFITHGMDWETIQAIGDHPQGRGLLDVRAAGSGSSLRLEDLRSDPRSFGFPPHHPPMRSLLRVPIRVRGTPFGQLYLTEKAGGPFTRRDELLVEALAGAAGFVIENAHAYGVSERRRRWLEMFGELTDRLMPPITLADALERIADAVRSASGARTASVVQVPGSGTPFAAATSGEALDLTAAEHRTLDEAVRSVASTGEGAEVPVRDGWVAVLAPLRAHLTIPGVLLIAHPRRGRPEDFEERDLLASFADQAALALDRTQALEDREKMAVVSDRDRIARELHDVVIQRLFATGLHMQSILAAAPTPELKARIDQAAKDLDQTIRDIRGTIFELQSTPQASLRSEIRDLVREFVPMLGFAPSVHMDGPVDKSVDPQVQQPLTAVIREALTNVAQHAEAGSASIELQVTDTDLRLKVSDNGKGVPDIREERGIRNARRRAVLLGGSLDLWPNDPSGTVFVWCVPLSPPSARTN